MPNSRWTKPSNNNIKFYIDVKSPATELEWKFLQSLKADDEQESPFISQYNNLQVKKLVRQMIVEVEYAVNMLMPEETGDNLAGVELYELSFVRSIEFRYPQVFLRARENGVYPEKGEKDLAIEDYEIFNLENHPIIGLIDAIKNGGGYDEPSYEGYSDYDRAYYYNSA